MRVTRLFTNHRFRTKMTGAFMSIAVLCALGGAYGLVVQARLGPRP